MIFNLTGKLLPYSLLSFGPEADPGVQGVSLQVTFKSASRRQAAITFHRVCSNTPPDNMKLLRNQWSDFKNS